MASFTDLAVSHYPNAVFLRHALQTWGSVPLWSPTILSGYPFFANPLAGLYYPPGWLALLLPLPLGLNLLAALHLGWGGLGLYHLLRRQGLEVGPALLGGLSFALLPKLMAHYGAGHLTLLYAVPWTPWLLLVTHSAAGQQQTRLARLAQPGLLLGLIFLADPRWAVFAGLAWVGYHLVYSTPPPSPITRLGRLGLQLLLAALVAAPLALPLLEYTRLSTRAALSPAEVLVFSLEPLRLLGLLFPGLSLTHEWVLYPGVTGFMLAGCGTGWGGLNRYGRFFLVLTLASLLLAFGEYLPGLSLLAGLPGVSWLRVPARGLFLAGLGLSGLAAQAAQAIWQGVSPRQKKTASLLWVGMAGLGLMLGVLLGFASRNRPAFILPAGLLMAGVALSYLRLAERMDRRAWLAGLFLLTLGDLGWQARALVSFRPADQVMSEGRALVEALPISSAPFRVYSPSYSLPQQTSALAGLELADGVDPLQLAAYTAYVQEASGVPAQGYSITLPPLAGDDLASANQSFRPQPRLLGLLNVRYVVSAFPLDGVGLVPLANLPEGYVYQNPLAMPRAWTQPPSQILGEQISTAPVVTWSPNKIVIDLPPESTQAVDAPLLVLSELDYPGWRVTVDGQKASLNQGMLLRVVQLPPGARQVVFTFRPTSLYLGLGLAGLGLLGLVFWSLRQ